MRSDVKDTLRAMAQRSMVQQPDDAPSEHKPVVINGEGHTIFVASSIAVEHVHLKEPPRKADGA